MRSEGYCTWSISFYVCLSVTTLSATTRNETTKERYQKVQHHTAFTLAIFVKAMRLTVMARKPTLEHNYKDLLQQDRLRNSTGQVVC